MAKKAFNHGATIRQLAKEIATILPEIQGSDYQELQTAFRVAKETIIYDRRLATQENIDALGELLKSPATHVTYKLYVANGLAAIGHHSKRAAELVADVFSNTLTTNRVEPSLENFLIDALISLGNFGKIKNSKVSDILIDYLVNHTPKYGVAEKLGSSLAKIGLKEGGELKNTIERNLLEASKNSSDTIRASGAAGLRLIRAHKLQAITELAAKLPTPRIF